MPLTTAEKEALYKLHDEETRLYNKQCIDRYCIKVGIQKTFEAQLATYPYGDAQYLVRMGAARWEGNKIILLVGESEARTMLTEHTQGVKDDHERAQMDGLGYSL
jgi:hypothetical protein